MRVALKAKYQSQSDIPEGQESFYLEKNGEYVLDVEGLEDAVTLKRTLDHEKRQRAAAITDKKSLEEKLAALEAKIQEAESKPQKSGESDDDVKRRIEAATKPLFEQVTNLTKALAATEEKSKAAEKKVREKDLLDKIRTAAGPLVREENMIDVINRTRAFIRENDAGEYEPFDDDGVLYDAKNPTKPMPIESLVRDRVLKDPTAAPLLKPSSGAGAAGGQAQGATMNGNTVLIPRGASPQVYQQMREQAIKAGKDYAVAPPA